MMDEPCPTEELVAFNDYGGEDDRRGGGGETGGKGKGKEEGRRDDRCLLVLCGLSNASY